MEWSRLDACSFVTFGEISKNCYRHIFRYLCTEIKQTHSQLMELQRNNKQFPLKTQASDVLLFMTVVISCAIYTQHRNPHRAVYTASPIVCAGLITSRLVATLHNAPQDSTPMNRSFNMLQKVFSFCLWCSQIRQNWRLEGEGWLTDSRFDQNLSDPTYSRNLTMHIGNSDTG
jgi:hypothetical protein